MMTQDIADESILSALWLLMRSRD